MPYLIDGHNLVPHLGLHLADPDDEAKLVAALQRYFARTRRQGTVYFDRQAPGGAAKQTSRHLAVQFIAPPRTADDAIRSHLARLRGEARNWVVVSNDQAVRQAAERAGARHISCGAFAGEVLAAQQAGTSEKPDEALSPEDLAEFERLFRDRDPGTPTS